MYTHNIHMYLEAPEKNRAEPLDVASMPSRHLGMSVGA